MLQRVLGLQVGDALLIQQQARGLEAFAKLFGVRPDLAAPAVGRWVCGEDGGLASRIRVCATSFAAVVHLIAELSQAWNVPTSGAAAFLLFPRGRVCAGCLMC
jgi:hypothetical protein